MDRIVAEWRVWLRRAMLVVRVAVAAVGLVALPATAAPQANDDCLACHSDKDLKSTRAGARPLFVDEAKFGASVHGKAACVDCHVALARKELPHDERLGRAECGSCHADEQRRHERSLHGQAIARGDPLAPHCGDCHGGHEIVGARDPRSPVQAGRIPYLCGSCHREGARVQQQREISQQNILSNYSESIHGVGLIEKGLIVAATCVSCHTAHDILRHTDPASSIARKNVAATCAKCHAQIEAVHRKVIAGQLWEREERVLPACVDCHEPHKARRVFYDQGMADRDCLRCHERRDIRASTDGRSLWVDSAEVSGSIHTRQACSQCHTGANASRMRPCETITTRVDCAACHADQVQQYGASVHGRLAAKQDVNAPTCKECHGTHGILGRQHTASPTYPTNVPSLCARCHRAGAKAAARYTGSQTEVVEHYTESIHGKGLLKSGLLVTATCTSCHTAHSELPRDSTRSSVNRDNIPATCGSCHAGIQEQFENSIHSSRVSTSKERLPVCSDCHTAHTIGRTDATGFRLTIMGQCGQCHEAVASTYFDTYHGKVSQLGYTKTAKCYDCHGAHDVLKVADPRSHLSRANVVETCQKCHPGATRRFAGYLTHATHHDPAKYPWLFWAFWGMTALLVGTFAVAGAHTLLWLPRALKMRREFGRHPGSETGQPEYERFSRLNRVLHISMIVSFITLAATGMSLKFSYTGWAVVVSRLLGGFETAGYIHRASAILMVAIFVTHIVDLVNRKRRNGQTWRGLLFGANTMLPTRKDLGDLIGSIKWFLGKGERPKYGRWTYWEKFDYMAVFWGIAVIGSTGLMLWFPNVFTRVLPGAVLNVATIIHSDEALLATGFIFTIHFFNTHLRPEKFPMDVVVFTGRIPVEELERDKPEEYKALVMSGELEQKLVPAYPPIVIRTIRAFAWTALTAGFLMIVWIVYAMVFAYR
jgi:cytochrome b subunit of formate dehydrogenase